MKKGFYTFHQNNSGGYFIENEEHGVCEVVIIEADSANAAYNKLLSIGSNVDGFNNYCACCGKRWSDWLDDTDATKIPEIYSESVETYKGGIFINKCFVHYMDGTFKSYSFL